MPPLKVARARVFSLSLPLALVLENLYQELREKLRAAALMKLKILYALFFAGKGNQMRIIYVMGKGITMA